MVTSENVGRITQLADTFAVGTPIVWRFTTTPRIRVARRARACRHSAFNVSASHRGDGPPVRATADFAHLDDVAERILGCRVRGGGMQRSRAVARHLAAPAPARFRARLAMASGRDHWRGCRQTGASPRRCGRRLRHVSRAAIPEYRLSRDGDDRERCSAGLPRRVCPIRNCSTPRAKAAAGYLAVAVVAVAYAGINRGRRVSPRVQTGTAKPQAFRAQRVRVQGSGFKVHGAGAEPGTLNPEPRLRTILRADGRG